MSAAEISTKNAVLKIFKIVFFSSNKPFYLKAPYS